MPEYENYARNESFGMYDNDDEEFMSNSEMNDSSYAAIEHNNTSKNGPNPGSLLYGTYDEAAEAASFQQALNAWRNPQSSSTQTPRNEAKKSVVKKTVNFNSRPAKGNITSRDSNVGTDMTESGRNTFRALEDQIKSNHSLTCGERMLLMKLRRDGKENLEEGEQRNNSYLIEEIPQTNSFKKSTPLDLETNLAPELIEIDKTDIPQDIGYKRPDSIMSVKRPQTSASRPGTARPNTARTSASRASIAYESHICRVPSATLKNITNRNLNLDEASIGQYQSGIGEFLLLDVAKDMKEKAPPSSARSEKSNEPFKLSHKCNLYNI